MHHGTRMVVVILSKPIAMRYPLILTLTLAHACLPVMGQNLFDVGLKGGVNLDDLKTQYSHERILGGHFGLFARVKPPILPGVQGELLLTSLGTHARVEGYESDVRTVALQVPLFAVLAIGPVELHGGGYYERYLTKNFINELDFEIEGQPVEIADLADDGFGVLLGAGVRFGHFYAGARYNMGMDALGSPPFLDDLYNRQLQFYLGMGFLDVGD